MTDRGFHPTHHVAKGEGFVPLVAAGALSKGFVHHAPADLLRTLVPPEPQAPRPELETDQTHPDPAPLPAPKPAFGTQPDEAALDAAFARGIAQGRTEAEVVFGALCAQLETAAGVLNHALGEIGTAMEDETMSLASVMEDVVLALASERAGVLISHDPASFARRIRCLAERISESFTQLSVRLNPADLAHLRLVRDPAELPELERLFEAELLPDPALAHGDIRLRAAGVALDDLLRPEIPA